MNIKKWEGPGRVYICSICGNMFSGYGNNPAPFQGEECCGRCNILAVIPARLETARLERSLTLKERSEILKASGIGITDAQRPNPSRIFSSEYSMELIAHIHEHPDCTKSEAIKTVARGRNEKTCFLVLHGLIDWGYIDVDDTIRKHNMIKLRLSHRGEMACEAIYMLDDTAEVDE